MDEKRYLISDAAKVVQAEPHVLRYWEEELSFRSRGRSWGIVTIPRKIFRPFRILRN